METIHLFKIFCTSDGCKSNNSYSLRTFSTGSSATFSLPTSSLTYLNQIFSFTVVKKIKVDSSYMYKLKSGYFISASSKYVEELKKQK